jgi:hypothetical protein
VAAILRPRAARHVLQELGWALSLQAAPIVATVHALRGRWDVWRPSPATPERSAPLAPLRTAPAE